MGKFINKKPYMSVRAGQFDFDFYYRQGQIKKCYLVIHDDNGLFSLRIAGNTDAYGYLIAAAIENKADNLQGYATLLFVPAMALMQDQKLTDDCVAAIDGYMERRQGKGAEDASLVTDRQEQEAQVFMEDVAEYADAGSDEECDAIRVRWKEDVKEAIHVEEEETESVVQRD